MAAAAARRLSQFSIKTVDEIEFAHAIFDAAEFAIAREIFELVGRKSTTRIASGGLAANKGNLSRIFECHASAVRSRAADPCRIDLNTGFGSMVDLTIRLNVLGMDVGRLADPPAKSKSARPYHPCKACYYLTNPRPTSAQEWTEGLASAALAAHANICPRFRGEIISG